MIAGPVRAVILAAGRGTRMRRPDESVRLEAGQAAAAASGRKGLIPIDGRPFLDYVLSSLADAEVPEACVVVGPGPSPIRERYGGLPAQRLRVAFAVQAEPKGTADALLAAREFCGSGQFLVLNSDNYYPLSALRALRALDGPGLAVFERERLLATSNFRRERIGAFAALKVSAQGDLEDIVEKGAAAQGGDPVLLSMNLWRFSPAIFEACRRVPASARGEYELPQAVRWALVHRGERFRAVRCDDGVLDLTARSDIASVARRLQAVAVRL
jgi:dTDP-glucose pyrophosphorylase